MMRCRREVVDVRIVVRAGGPSAHARGGRVAQPQPGKAGEPQRDAVTAATASIPTPKRSCVKVWKYGIASRESHAG